MTHENGQAVVIAGGFGSAARDDDDEATDARVDLRNFERLPARDVPVSALSSELQVRQGGTDAVHVQLLLDAAGSAELPPILVQQNGSRVIDGLHRLEAAKLRGDRLIKARFLDCTDSEALVLAIEANCSHGLPLSKADRVCGARRVLAAHADWSDRAIAGVTGLSAKTIASLRAQSADGTHLGGKRLGRDGRRRPVTADEGRRRAAEYIRANPHAPLRQVARETDLSLGTVHDVSTRLRLGVSPERDGRRVSAGRPAVHGVPAGRPAVHGLPAGRPAVHGLPTGRPAVHGLPTGRPAGHPGDGVVAPVTAAPGADGTPLRQRKNHTAPPPTWAGVGANVAKDPTIRYTEGGKEFLRWMALHATDPDGWREFVNSIPAHWSSVIAPIADSISKEWSEFAEQLKQAGRGAMGA